MKVQLEHIVQNLFQKATLEEVRVDELQQLVKEHPYFSAGHFLLAQKLMQQHNGEYEAQAQKAALYFHDPLWLQWQLKQVSNGLQEKELEPEEEIAVTTVGPVEEAIPATPAEVEQNMPDEKESPAPGETIEATEQPEETQAYESSADAEHPAEQEFVHQTESFHDPEPQQEIQLVQESKPEEKPEPAIPFDPYYTIDYFASQGIKAPTEVQPGDKLGKQLKSFTEWLKTMKRLPQPQAEVRHVNEAEQQTIRQFAAGSLEEKEVVTETMAEVLHKQGRHAEAIAIYQKLSLSDPSKSAYFAAKIEKLKEN
jgi:hypothetical protein